MNNTLRRQKLFIVSIIGIIVVSLALTYTYAYQNLVVTKANGSNDNVEVAGGVLDVRFTSTSRINLSNLPLTTNYSSNSYTEFTIDNTNSTENAVYRLKLVDLEYSNSLISKDFRYTITESNNVVGEGNFSDLTSDEYILTFNNANNILVNKNATKTFKLYLWLKETSENQNSLESTSFKGKIEIDSYFESQAKNMNLSKLRIYGNSVQDSNTLEIQNVESLADNLLSLKTENLKTNSNIQDLTIDNTNGKISYTGSSGASYYVSSKQIFSAGTYELNYQSDKTVYIIFGWNDSNITVNNTNLENNHTAIKSWFDSQKGGYYSTLNGNQTLKIVSDSDFYIGFATLSEYTTISNIQLTKSNSDNFEPYGYKVPIYIYDSKNWEDTNLGEYSYRKSTISRFYADDISSINIYLSQSDMNTPKNIYVINNTGKIVEKAAYVICDQNPQSLYKDGKITIGIPTVNYNNKICIVSKDNNDTQDFLKTILGTYIIYPKKESTDNSDKPTYTNIYISDSLKKVGNIEDYIDYIKGKVIRNIGVIESYNGETINTDYISSTGSLTTGATVYYVLNNPIEENINNTEGIKYNNILIGTKIRPSKIELSI